MSAPQKGDRVTVVAGQFAGWRGTILHRLPQHHLQVRLVAGDRTYVRPLTRDEVQVIRTTPVSGAQGDADASGAPVEVPAADGAQNGGKR